MSFPQKINKKVTMRVNMTAEIWQSYGGKNTPK